MKRRRVVLAVLAIAGLGLGGRAAWRAAHPPPPETSHATPLSAISTRVGEVNRTDWLTTHFATPLAPQGPAPVGWSPSETSLSQTACAMCHVEQAAAWSTSRHALAMGAGVVGQDLAHTAGGEACGTCHAPLAEQAADPALAAEGVNCAGCHVRAWARSGPPSDGPVLEGVAPHGGFEARTEFTDPAFCSTCHDFSAKAQAPSGKRLQETTEEWRRTPAAAAGQTCQSCHMPKGDHSFKGIHDAELVRSAFTAAVRFMTDGGRIVGKLTVTATEGVGHRLPTYTTPELWLTIVQLDASGLILPGSQRESVIGRRMNADNTVELFDTRLMPGEAWLLMYNAELDPDCTALLAKVEVRPDAAYELRYAGWIKEGRGETETLKTALAAAKASRFVAWQERVALPR